MWKSDWPCSDGFSPESLNEEVWVGRKVSGLMAGIDVKDGCFNEAARLEMGRNSGEVAFSVRC